MLSTPTEEEDKKKDHEKILEEIIVDPPKMGKAISTQVQETQRVPNRINAHQTKQKRKRQGIYLINNSK